MAIPSLAMIPSGYKDGKVYSVLPTNGDGDFTFARGSNATRVNKDGLIEDVLELGSELVTNGGFDSDSGWNKYDSFIISGGVASASSQGSLTQDSIFQSNKRYIVRFDLTSNGQQLNLWVNGTQLVFASSLSSGSYTYDVLATTSGLLYFEVTSSFIGSIDNVSVKEVTSGYDTPRLDYTDSSCPSLLLEPQSTNYDSESENLSTSYMSNSSGIQSSSLVPEVAPDGSINSVYKISKVTDNSDPYIGRSGVSFTNTSMVFSAWLWTDENQPKDVMFLVYRDGVQEVQTENITLTTTPTRYFIEASFTTTPSNVSYRIDLTPNSSNQYIYAWGKQLEQGSYATSYIPTSGSIVTRLADSCYQDNLLTDIINASYPFTMYAAAKAVFDSAQNFLTFGNRGATNQYFTLVLNNDGTIKLAARANGISENLASTASAISNGEFFKVAVSMESATSGKISVNGNLDSKTNFTQQSVNTDINDLLLGQLRTISDTGQRIPISDVRIYNTALTDQELIALTRI